MNTIKFTSKTTCRLNGIEYKGYTVGDLPNSFGFKENILVKMKMVLTNLNLVKQNGLT